MIMPLKHLYIIGNGFDRYHGAESGYLDFRKYLYKRAPEVEACFDLYFGPKSLRRSFVHEEGWWDCYQTALLGRQDAYYRYPRTTWSWSNLWCDFEKYLSELNREKIFDVLDLRMPSVDEGERGFRYSDYYIGLDEISSMVWNCTERMKYHFHKWVNTLHYAKGFKKRMIPIRTDAMFLNFNYTTFLESEYGVPHDSILYIHGCRKDKLGSLVLGHNGNDEKLFDRWYHKNKNRKRYRAVQKDKRGRFFLNDKLVYLAYFLEDETKGNWRLTTRYYIVQEAVERFESYYESNYKDASLIIKQHNDFFESLGNIECVEVLGHSLSDVDMPYYDRIKLSLPSNVVWLFSCHSERDLSQIRRFCMRMNIKDTHYKIREW